MSYIVWDNEEAYSFRDEVTALAYLKEVETDDPFISFDGWGKTKTNSYNHIFIARDYDTKKPWENAPKYMQPTHQHQQQQDYNSK